MEDYSFPNLSKGRRGDGTNADKEEQTAAKKPRVTTSEGPTDAGAMECQTACETNSEGQTGNTWQKHPGELMPHAAEKKETRNRGRHEEDEVQAERREASSHQAGGVERHGGREAVKMLIDIEPPHPSVGETNRERRGDDWGTPREVKSSRDEEKQRNLPPYGDPRYVSVTETSTTEMKHGAALGRKAYYTEHYLDQKRMTYDGTRGAAKTPRVTTSEGPTDAGAMECQTACETNSEGQTGNTWQKHPGELMPHAAEKKETRNRGRHEEDEVQAERREASSHQAGGVERHGGREAVKMLIDIEPPHPSVGETNRERRGDDWGTPREVKSSRDEEKQRNLPPYGDPRYVSVTETSTTEMKHGAALGRKAYYTEHYLDQKRMTYDGTRGVKLPHYGLYNQGATCYLNSVLQVLSMTTEMHDRLDSKSETDQELRKLFKGLKEHSCGTEDITSSLKIGNVSEQRDAAECLELILREISPQASKVFHGELAYKTKCCKDHIINEEANEFWTLPLSLEDVRGAIYSVEKSMESFFVTKSITESCKVYCNDCDDETDATSGCEMVEQPQILTLLLKRFDFDDYTMSYVKLGCCVEVPSLLQLKDKKYKLYGMVNHSGSLRGGHYTATILSSKDNSWYRFDDTRVFKVENPFASSITYKSRSVYLLMYRATDSQETIDTKHSGDETKTLHQPTEEPSKSRESSVVLFLIVFCCTLWLGAVIFAIASFSIL
ncbi:uncharacterized protein [Chaetodon trifascialis]|uniref:uncharacterized protein n=1 Tax=Chaetodon trifascialis TaxID=109706 RepID=UPI003994834B